MVTSEQAALRTSLKFLGKPLQRFNINVSRIVTPLLTLVAIIHFEYHGVGPARAVDAVVILKSD